MRQAFKNRPTPPIGQEGSHYRLRSGRLTAANDLIAKNFEVTVFEALPAAGG